MKSYKLKIADRVFEIEFPNWASQASASSLVRLGETEVLAVVVASEEEKNVDYLPLLVEYQERYYAAGKILGSRFIRRELRPSDEAICTARMIDRSIRPLFPKDLKRELQVIITCLSWDEKNDPDIPALLASSLAISLSEIPFSGPIAPLRVGKINGKIILNPSYQERKTSQMDLVLVGVEGEKDFLLNMIEAEGKEFDENLLLDSFKISKPYFKKIIEIQKKIIKERGKKKFSVLKKKIPKVEKEVKKFLEGKLIKLIEEKDNLVRKDIFENIRDELKNFLEKNYPEDISFGFDLFYRLYQEKVRKLILEKERRLDKRKLDEIRPLKIEVGLLPRTHGSALFQRGETKALSILTLGAPGDTKILEGMEFIGEKRFIHHYNFPPYSAGEIRPLKGPGRREIGHGMLVEKALLPVVPNFKEFPYSMRVVSEILSSNGSTSMASVCASALALADGGVPLKRPVSGIALGLVCENKNPEGKYKILADIQGPEDSFGDMDFKVGGTEKGITAIQLDVKIKGINESILRESLNLAKKCRLFILKKMKEILPHPRRELSKYAPLIKVLKINPERIGEVIGPKGSQINEIIEKCEVSIDIEPEGVIYITSEKKEGIEKAAEWIKNITRQIRVGQIFKGKVKRILNFGILVEILPHQVGLVHRSKLVPFKIKDISTVVKVGDIIPVKVIAIDELGRVNLSAIEAGFRPKFKKYGRRT